MEKKLEVRNLQISFRTQGGILKAVRNISFDLYRGETLAIVGESGSGKSVTSKAIMGILAGNSIVEGGEILYDGQDLLKISEEDFHKLRGDKVAMIFQDPMSSLNPIMRVGQQLTEAMILKAKTGKKNARNAFNSKLKLLGESINAADKAAGVDNSADVAAKLKKFNAFCVTASKIELEYNEANGNAMQLEIDLENALLMLEKQKKFDIVAEAKRYRKLLLKSINPYVVPKGEKSDALVASLTELIGKGKAATPADALEVFTALEAYIENALKQEKPNFFTLGYYVTAKPGEDLSKMPVAEMNKLTREFLDNGFMLDFIATAEKGVAYSYERSIEEKRKCITALQKALEYFKAGNIEHGTAREYLKNLSAEVGCAIDRLAIKKESVEYVFHSALSNAIDDYFAAIKRNPIEEKIYLKNKAKYDKASAKGKTPDYEVPAAALVDKEVVKGNILRLINRLADVSFINGASDFRVFTRKMANAMISLPEYFRFSKGLFSYVGFETYYYPYQAQPRANGESKWSFRKLFQYAIEGIVSFSTAPLRFATILGLLFSAASFIYLIAVIIEKLTFGVDVAGYPTIVVLILLVGGIQLFALGIIGEYLGRNYMESKKRPVFFIRDIYSNHKDDQE